MNAIDHARALLAQYGDIKPHAADYRDALRDLLALTEQAFVDGYGAAYIKARPRRFVAMADYEDEARSALAEWYRAESTAGSLHEDDADHNACRGCGAEIDDDRTHCGALECGGGSLPEIERISPLATTPPTGRADGEGW